MFANGSMYVHRGHRAARLSTGGKCNHDDERKSDRKRTSWYINDRATRRAGIDDFSIFTALLAPQIPCANIRGQVVQVRLAHHCAGGTIQLRCALFR